MLRIGCDSLISITGLRVLSCCSRVSDDFKSCSILSTISVLSIPRYWQYVRAKPLINTEVGPLSGLPSSIASRIFTAMCKWPDTLSRDRFLAILASRIFWPSCRRDSSSCGTNYSSCGTNSSSCGTNSSSCGTNFSFLGLFIVIFFFLGIPYLITTVSETC